MYAHVSFANPNIVYLWSCYIYSEYHQHFTQHDARITAVFKTRGHHLSVFSHLIYCFCVLFFFYFEYLNNFFTFHFQCLNIMNENRIVLKRVYLQFYAIILSYQ